MTEETQEPHYITEFKDFERSENRYGCMLGGLCALTLAFDLVALIIIGCAIHNARNEERELDAFLNSPTVQYNIGDDYHSYRPHGGPM